ncbi:biotin--[acetyl-CoA-carboxylase] ligase [Nakamurella endophytica]|uniref:biotin--[biotin carboxyl-carrier protein] ligase n=1 Tax=Nakamurella endophytica TaxID=1748367 RepID=A0A917WGE2_9ACTN|nr:biotin--[acetyl-CoA-carboxylase] ligase [Nakamurella endophytica]GGM01843.1 biotin--[acetyl-CoA-carboxylase] ligase [Nakamurella endophytica]
MSTDQDQDQDTDEDTDRDTDGDTEVDIGPADPRDLRGPLDLGRLGPLRLPVPVDLRHVAATGSTNADLAAGPAVAADGPWPVLVTEEQRAGRGRSGRTWTCPAGAGLMVSIRVPMVAVPPARRGWTGAVLGLALVAAVRSAAGLAADRPRLKWPNDLLVDGHKCAGVLAEAVGPDVVVGAGLNVSLTAAELPRPDATSLLLAGGGTDRGALLAAVLESFTGWVLHWFDAGGDVDAAGIRPAYLDRCGTLGARVRVELPGGGVDTGEAVDVDPDGALVVRSDTGRRQRYSAADVVHLRRG